MSLVIDQLITLYGAYYRTGGPVGRNNIRRHIFERTATKKLFNIRQTDNTIIDNVNVAVASVLQPFYAKFSAKGQIKYEPNQFQLQHVKINESIRPDEVSATALDFLATRTPDRMDAPLLAVVAEYLLQKAMEDDEDEVVFKGVRALPTQLQMDAGTAGTTVGSRDGIRKKIRGYNTAGKLVDETGASNVIAMGAVPTDGGLMIEYVKDFYYSIPQKFRKDMKAIAMSSGNAELFQLGMAEVHNVNYDKLGGQFAKIINTNCEIVGCDSMIGSSMMWVSPRENNIGFVKNGTNNGVLDMHKSSMYEIHMGTDWWEGQDFITPQLIYVNGQDLA